MNPENEDILEDALQPIKPSSAEVGRVLIEPDYEVGIEPSDAKQLSIEIERLLQEQTPDPDKLTSHDGFTVKIPSQYPMLTKHIRRISLHSDRAEGQWIEVLPPGNWI